MNESNIVCMSVYVYNFLLFFQLQSPEVTRHAVGKTTAFGILQKGNKKKYTHMSVWSERKECVIKIRTYTFTTDRCLSPFSFNTVRMLVCLRAMVSAGLASAKRAAGNKPYTGIGALYRREVRRI